MTAFQASVQERFIEGCIRLKHLQSIGFCNIPTIRVGLNHHEGNLIPLQLGCDLLTDAPVAAEDDVIVQAFQHAVDAELLQSAEITRVLQAKHPLNGQLNNDQATDHDQHRHQPSSWGEGFHLPVADGADGDQHHPQTVPPIPAFREAVTDRTDQDHGR